MSNVNPIQEFVKVRNMPAVVIMVVAVVKPRGHGISQ